MKKFLSVILSGVLAASMLAGCGGSGASSAPASSAAPAPAPASSAAASSEAPAAEPAETFEEVKLRVAYMPNMGSASLLVTARDKGFFEKMGITVDLVEFQGGPAEISAMASGDIDIAQIGHGAHALCAEGEAMIFEIDCTSLADAVMGNKEQGVNSIADLKGKKVATTAGTSAEIILNLALASEGLSQSDLEIVEMDANGMVSAMISGNIDACATWSPGTMTITTAMGDKVVTLATNNDYLDQATFPSSMITTKKYADENRDILVRFTRALQMAMDYRAANIDEIAKLVAKQCMVDEQTMLDCVGEGNWLTGEFVASAVKEGTIKSYYENQQKVFIDGGRLTEAVDVNNYVLFDVMEEAAEANAKAA